MGSSVATSRRARPVTDLSQLPLVLRIEDMLRILRIGRSTLDHQLANGTFRPAPFARWPYRWRRADVQRVLEDGHDPTNGHPVSLARRPRRRPTG